MTSKKLILSAVCIILVASVAIYGVLNTTLLSNNQSPGSSGGSDTDDTPSPTATATATATPTAQPTVSPTDGDSGSDSSGSTVDTVSSENAASHEEASDYTYDSSQATEIALNGDSISVNGSGASVSGSTVTIAASGTYRITGSLTNGQVIVDTQDKKAVQLILAGVDITCSNSAPIYVLNADKVILILEASTENKLAYTSSATTDPNAAIYSKSDLTIYGDGSLNVQSTYDGITGKDGLIIKSGTVTVNAEDDGIRGKDYLIVEGGKIMVTAGDNGLISDNTLDATKGYVSIEAGTVTVTSGGDAIQGETDVLIASGTVTVTSGGGSSGSVASGVSAKGIKGLVNITIDGGTINVNSADDTIHSNGTVTVNGGTFTLSTGDDGIHADTAITINSGNINIANSYEGIESLTITINGGTIYVNSSDDGLNGAGGQDSSGFAGGQGPMGGGDMFSGGNANVYINGGYLVVAASGDGLDSNGAITQTGGTVIVNGPTDNGNGPLDFSTYKMTGGFLIAAGSSGMAQALSSTSTQCSVLLNFQTSYSAGTLVHIESSSGTNIATFQASKQFQSIVVCTPSMTKGSTYNIYVGGSCSGTLKDGVYTGGTYTPGTLYTSFTASSVVTSLGNGGGFPR